MRHPGGSAGPFECKLWNQPTLICCHESAVESSCAPVITQAKKTTAFTDLLGKVFGKHLDVLQLWPMDRA